MYGSYIFTVSRSCAQLSPTHFKQHVSYIPAEQLQLVLSLAVLPTFLAYCTDYKRLTHWCVQPPWGHEAGASYLMP